MIVDLFSHKIHSSRNDWPEKLAELAAIFGEFDGQLFDRAAFEKRLQQISPRASYWYSATGRLDESKFRDEISAYPAYLGLYCLEQSNAGWVVRVSETARRFLLREEPDTASFLRLQLPLFQYPNAMGAAYRSATNRLRIQANARDRALGYIAEGVHVSPVRLIAVALQADVRLRGVRKLEAAVTFDEIFGLANLPNINRQALPALDSVADALTRIRGGSVQIPKRYESRFHTLRHTEMFVLRQRTVQLRPTVNQFDASQLLRQFEAISTIENQFNGFDGCKSGDDLEGVIASGEWGRYFDGIRILPSNIVEALATDYAVALEPSRLREATPLPQPLPEVYPLRPWGARPTPPRPYDRQREFADPEVTRIKRQRRNLAHKELIGKMDTWLRRIGARPKDNEHIDLFARIPNDGSFIFEMKSGGDNILDQIRKGISQLYEYRYRYKRAIGDDDISLCLVLPEEPSSIPWISDYICQDRDINLCWFDEAGEPEWPELCAQGMHVLSSAPRAGGPAQP